MVLQTERYNGGYLQQSYSPYEGPIDGYTSYQRVTEYTTPYSGAFHVSPYPSSHGSHHQSVWSSGGDYYGSGANHHPVGGKVVPLSPTSYDSSLYENSYTHGNSNKHENSHHQGYGSPHGQDHRSSHHQGHGSPHGKGHGSPHHQGHGSPYGQGHGSPYGQGHGSPHHEDHGSPYSQGHSNQHGFGKTNGLGGVITTHINKLTHGHDNYGHIPSGFNHGYQKPSWTLKGLDDE